MDFVPWDDNHYVSLDSAVLANPRHIGNKAGEARLNVSAHINSSHYQAKTGPEVSYLPGGKAVVMVSLGPGIPSGRNRIRYPSLG